MTSDPMPPDPMTSTQMNPTPMTSTQMNPAPIASVRIAIVIVNYRTPQLACDCLNSLQREILKFPQSHVWMIDNASGDQSGTMLQEWIESHSASWVTLRLMAENRGYAYGNNIGIREALESSTRFDYIWLLNPDTEVRENALTHLVSFLEAHPHIGLAGSRLEFADGTPQTSAFRFPSVLGEIEEGMRLGLISKLLARWRVPPPPQDQAHRCDWVAGASLLIRREVFDSIGLLDERYFLYFEETDFCYRAARAGWPCWYVPESRVIHYVGQSTGVTDRQTRPKRRPAYWFESRSRYFRQNHNTTIALLADLAYIVSFTLWRIRRRLQKKPDTDPPHFLKDLIRHACISVLHGRPA